MKWILLLMSIVLLTGCNEKKVVNNENNTKVESDSINETTEAKQNELREQASQNTINKTEEPVELPSEVESHIEEQASIPVQEEEFVVQQINELEEDVSRLLATEQTETIKEKVIEKFITLVDFIYYDEPIGNVYFKDLTESMKENVCSILARMDAMIENKLPNYKDTLKEKYQQALHYVKTQVGKVGEKIEEAIGEDNYQNFMDAKDDLKESFQNTAEWIKEGSSKIYESGKEKVSNWYQNFKEKHEK